MVLQRIHIVVIDSDWVHRRLTHQTSGKLIAQQYQDHQNQRPMGQLSLAPAERLIL